MNISDQQFYRIVNTVTEMPMYAKLGTVYTKPQCQHCDNSVMTLAILFSLKTMEPLKIGVATHFSATLLFSMRAESPGSLWSCRSFDVDAWCKQALTIINYI